jgi:hypothetical protein
MPETKPDVCIPKPRDGRYHAITLVVLLVCAGCATAPAGRLESNPEVTRAFQNNEIMPNHQYYISGFQTLPYAIIAVDENYQLRPSRWTPIDMNPEVLNVLIYRMDQVYSLNPRGAWILDSEGNRLGAWFSSQYQTTIRRQKDDQITILAPDPPDLRGIP